jgi:hypothetical protein
MSSGTIAVIAPVAESTVNHEGSAEPSASAADQVEPSPAVRPAGGSRVTVARLTVRVPFEVEPIAVTRIESPSSSRSLSSRVETATVTRPFSTVSIRSRIASGRSAWGVTLKTICAGAVETPPFSSVA